MHATYRIMLLSMSQVSPQQHLLRGNTTPSCTPTLCPHPLDHSPTHLLQGNTTVAPAPVPLEGVTSTRAQCQAAPRPALSCHILSRWRVPRSEHLMKKVSTW